MFKENSVLGYDRKGDELVVDEVEAEILKHFFDKFLTSEELQEIPEHRKEYLEKKDEEYKLLQEEGEKMSHSIEEILAEGGIECEYCGEPMLKSPGCKCSEIESNGVRYERIKYGEGDYDFDECCHDCGAKEGHYHHSGCDNEICPVCGEQLIGCDCDLEFIF